MTAPFRARVGQKNSSMVWGRIAGRKKKMGQEPGKFTTVMPHFKKIIM